MSLINDALKRASQTAKDRPSQANLPTPMEPVQESAPPKSRFIFVGVPVAVAMVALAGWFFWQWFHERHAHPAHSPGAPSTAVAPRPAFIPTAPQATPVRPPRPTGGAATPAIAVRSAAAPAGGAPRAIVPPVNPPNPVAYARPAAPVSSPTPAPMTAAIQQPAPVQPSIPFPKLQVKGIFYNRSRPYALINGETVGEGEYILGVRVVKIQPDRVILELKGVTKQLILGE